MLPHWGLSSYYRSLVACTKIPWLSPLDRESVLRCLPAHISSPSRRSSSSVFSSPHATFITMQPSITTQIEDCFVHKNLRSRRANFQLLLGLSLLTLIGYPGYVRDKNMASYSEAGLTKLPFVHLSHAKTYAQPSSLLEFANSSRSLEGFPHCHKGGNESGLNS